MGDRANVYIADQFTPASGVYLYVHWEGAELPLLVQTALRRKIRWDDAQYLARIIFDELVKPPRGRETGVGLSASLCDNDRPSIIRLDCQQQRISFVPRGDEHEPTTEGWTFEEYTGLRDREITSHWEDRRRLARVRTPVRDEVDQATRREMPSDLPF